MQEELDYLEEVIPKQSDEELLKVLTVNVAIHNSLALDFIVEELRTRGFKIEPADHDFEVITPTGCALKFPKKTRTADEISESYTYPSGADTMPARELLGVGGWLGFLIFDLAVFSPLFFLVISYKLGNGLNIIINYPLLGWLIMLNRVLGMAIAFGGVYAGVQLYRVRPGAVRFTKRFIIISGVPVTAVSVLIYLAATQTGVPAIKENARSIPTFIALGWFGRGVWYLYLSYSRRVAATFGLMNDQGA
jgi:hypothetical protein